MTRKLFIGTTVCVLLFFFFLFTGRGESQTGETVGLWTFDDGPGSAAAKDSSGKENHGKLVNMDSSGAWREGRFTYKGNYGLDFDGVAAHVIIPDAPGLNPSGEITMMAWVYRRSTKGVDVISRKSFLGYRLGAGIATVKTTGREQPYDLVGSKPGLNEWHHIAATYDGKELKLYLDGKLDTRMPVEGSLVQIKAPLYIGARAVGNNPTDFFHGIIDEVKISSRALSGEEILHDYNYTLKEKADKLGISVSGDYVEEKLEVRVDVSAVERLDGDINGYVELRHVSKLEPAYKKKISGISEKEPLKPVTFDISNFPPGEYEVRAYLTDKEGGVISAARKYTYILPGKNAVVVPYVKTPPVIDGKMGGEEWACASSVTGFVELTGLLAKEQTQVFLCYDDKNLYAAFKSFFPGQLEKNVTQRDNVKVFGDDAFEIFLQPGASGAYYQFGANSIDTLYESRGKDALWNGKWQSKSRADLEGEFFVGGCWTAEVSIPFDELGAKSPGEGEVWGGNFCRDWTLAGGKYWTSWAYAQGNFHNPDIFGKLMFSRTAPAIQVEHLGSPGEGELNITGKIVNASSVQNNLSIQSAIVSKVTGETRLAEVSSVAAGPGKRALFTVQRTVSSASGASEPHELFIFASDAKDRTLYRERIPFALSPGFGLSLTKNYADGVLFARTDIERLQGLPESFKGYAEVRKRGVTEPLITAELKNLASGNRTDEARFDISKFAPGEYEARAYLLDEKKKELATQSTGFTVPEKPAWLGNRLGISDKPPSPWTPVEFSGNTVCCWGRKYEFGGLPFPSKIITGGESILSAPIELKGVVNGVPVKWTAAGLRRVSGNDAGVSLEMNAASSSLKLKGRVKIEYDGLMKIDFSLIPDGEAKIDSLVLEIPVNRKNAKYLKARRLFNVPILIFASIGDEAMASGEVHQVKPGNVWNYSPTGWRWENVFVNSLWVGDDERGLLWLCESEENWKTGKKIIELTENRETTIVRFNIVGAPLSVKKELNYTIGLQATPSKPFPAEYLKVAKTVFSPVSPASAGVYWTSAWTDNYGYLKPKDPQGLKKKIEEAHKQGVQFLLGFSFLNTDTRTDEFRVFGDEWAAHPLKYAQEGKSLVTPICTESSWPDFMLYRMEKMLEEYDFDGFYLDCSGCYHCVNYSHGCGYRDEKGIWQPKANIFATHEYYKRVYTLFKSKGKELPFIFHHRLEPELASFVDVATTGEAYDRNYDNLFANDCRQFRAEFMETQFGTIPQFYPVLNIHYYYNGPNVSMEEIFALTLIHNVLPTAVSSMNPEVSRPMEIKKGPEKGRMVETNQLKSLAAVWKVLGDFGIDGAEWHPYWKNQDFIRSSAEKVKASFYKKDGGALIVVSNIGDEEADATLNVNLPSFGFSSRGLKAKDPVSGEEFSADGGKIKLPALPSRRMRFLLLN